MALLVTGKWESIGLAAVPAVFSCVVCCISLRRAGTGRGRQTAFFGIPVLGIALFLAGGCAGFIRMEYEEWKVLREEAVSSGWKGSCVRVEGIVGEISESGYGYRLTLRCCAGEQDTAPGRIYCYTENPDPGLKIGMRILAEGEGEAPEPAGNPGGFDYRLFCRARGITGILYGEKVRILDARHCLPAEMIRQVRNNLAGKLDRIAEPEDAGILKAVLLGIRSDLDDEVYEQYRKNGISHLLAISGLHVSMIGMGLWKVLRKCGAGYRTAGAAAWGLLLLYGGMTGFGPSVSRAVCMSGISFLAAALGRTYDLPSAMCVPAMGLLLLRPYLLTQASFQLSFLCVGAVFFPGGYLIKRRNVKGAAAALFMSTSIQAVTAPAILYHSFELPVYSAFLNLLVIPLMTYAAASGFLGLFAGFVSPAAGMGLLGGAHYILKFYGWLGNVFLKLPGACAVLGQPELWQTALFYTVLLAGTLLMGEEGERRDSGPAGLSRTFCLRLGGAGLWAAGFLILLPVPERGLCVTFLNVGQGDGIVLEADGCTVLVDCGSSQKKSPGEDCLVPYLKSRGITHIDMAVASHGDLDHINGILYVLETPDCGIRIRTLVMPAAGMGEAAYGELEAASRAAGTQIVYAGRGDELFVGPPEKMRIYCLSPPKGKTFTDRNAESLVLLAEYGDFRLLLTGDMEKEGEEELLKSVDLEPVTVLKAAHHGSATSTGEEFLQAADPLAAVISYGQGNRYGHPAKEVTDRLLKNGVRIFETAKEGAVMIRTDGRTMRITGFLTGRAGSDMFGR